MGSGPTHRHRLGEMDTRIVVSGVRGKSTVTTWLHDVLHRRGYDTYAKLTGEEPISMYNGERHEIERTEQVRLYENERELQRFGNIDAAVFENQGLRQYTTRLVNESYVEPDVIFLTNVRADHLDSLGRDRIQVARALARAVPSGTVVVNGEQNSELRSYLTAELQRRDAVIRHVDIPSDVSMIPGAELVYGLNEVLDAVDEEPILPDELSRKLAAMCPRWRVLPEGRVYNAASVNDVQSTELVRRALLDGNHEPIEPLVSLRSDRRGRTASFLRYLSRLAEDGLIVGAHVLGGGSDAFAFTADFPVRVHDPDTETPSSVLDDCLATNRPLIVMGNRVSEFMEELESCLAQRTVEVASSSLADDTQLLREQ